MKHARFAPTAAELELAELRERLQAEKLKVQVLSIYGISQFKNDWKPEEAGKYVGIGDDMVMDLLAAGAAVPAGA